MRLLSFLLRLRHRYGSGKLLNEVGLFSLFFTATLFVCSTLLLLLISKRFFFFNRSNVYWLLVFMFILFCVWNVTFLLIYFVIVIEVLMSEATCEKHRVDIFAKRDVISDSHGSSTKFSDHFFVGCGRCLWFYLIFSFSLGLTFYVFLCLCHIGIYNFERLLFFRAFRSFLTSS